MIEALRLALLDRSVHPVVYVLRAWPAALVPTIGVATTLSIIAHIVGLEHLFDNSQFDALFDMTPTMLLLQVIVVAPILETLLMAPLLALYVRLFRRRRWAVLASAFTWAVLHSLSAPIWGLCIFWTFVVFSTAFLVWRDVSLWHALGVTAAIHALNNAIAGLGLAFS